MPRPSPPPVRVRPRSLGKALRALRRSQDLTQEVVISRLPPDVVLSRPSLSMIERGCQRLHEDTFLALCHALGVEPYVTFKRKRP